jgi:membrane associated rhomboid family serine protease
LSIIGIVIVGLFGAWAVALVAVPLAVAARDTRRDRRRILAEGKTVQGTITAIGPPDRSGCRSVSVEFEPAGGSGRIAVEQTAAAETVELAGLAVGSPTQLHYLEKTPRAAFVDALTLAERLLPASALATQTDDSRPDVYFVAFTDPAKSHYAPGAPTNAYRWFGPGDVTFRQETVRFVARRRRPLWVPANVEREFARQSIANVEVLGNAVRFEIVEADQPARGLQFWTVDSAEAADIAARLPSTRTEAFSPALADAAAFDQRLRTLAPTTPVTFSLIAINCAVFVIAAALGAGVFSPNGEVIARLGSDFTPLTLGGQWWRLLTSIFLHFGLFHVALNMWALYVNGPLAERVFGSARYLVIYVSAGLAGSVASLWWHPVVNGAGASGAIFGVFGSILAFFLRKGGGVPDSVVKRHRASVSVFIAYNLLNGVRFSAIDNAAHIGGLASGFVLGFLLTRPLDRTRATPASDYRLAIAVAVFTCVGLLYSFVRSPSTNALLVEIEAVNRRNAPSSPPPRSPGTTSAKREDTESAVPPNNQPAVPIYTAAEYAACTRHCAPLFADKAMECLRQCDIHQPDRYAALRPPPLITTFWGIELGERREHVELKKGKPLRVEQGVAIYSATSSRNGGLMEVSYRPASQPGRDEVAAIFYRGDRASAPPELPFINGTMGEQLVGRYKMPIWTSVPDNNSELEMFSTGLTAYLWHREVKRCGIQSYYREP